MDGKPTEQIALNAETCDNILQMMNSVDGENKVVALSCIDNVDFNKNLTYILILKKQSSASTADWKEFAPNTTKMLTGIGVDVDSVLSYKQVLEILVKRKVPTEDIQFYLDRFAKYLYSSIKGLGYDFIDTLEIKLKLKTDDGEQTHTVTEA
jgi:hypothetical protein